MIYKLTFTQEKKFWSSVSYKNFVLAARSYRVFDLRTQYWNKFIEPIYHIQYNPKINGYSNILEGEEKHINWFLLKHDLL